MKSFGLLKGFRNGGIDLSQYGFIEGSDFTTVLFSTVVNKWKRMGR